MIRTNPLEDIILVIDTSRLSRTTLNTISLFVLATLGSSLQAEPAARSDSEIQSLLAYHSGLRVTDHSLDVGLVGAVSPKWGWLTTTGVIEGCTGQDCLAL